MMSTGATTERQALTVEIQIVHEANIRLGFTANEADAFGFSAIAFLCFMSGTIVRLTCPLIAKVGLPVAIDVVIESKLFAVLHFPLGEDAHAKPSAYHPFGNVAVRVTRMI